ncbi:MAG TPA: DUF1761 domain-containing protein [Gammaproteobacteria bacterium]|jgi:hypothetical protein
MGEGYLHINFLAAIVAAVVTFGIGALWYSPFLFGKQWMEFNGVTAEKAEAMRKHAPQLYGISFVGYLVMAVVFAILLRLTHIEHLLGGAKLGFLIWVGFVATVGLTASLYGGRNLKAYALDAGYQLVYLVVMGLILMAWH